MSRPRAEVLQPDHMPGLLLNPGYVFLPQPRIILCTSSFFHLESPKKPFSKVESLLKSLCQSHSQLNVLCVLVTGVFHTIWGINMSLSIRQSRLIGIVIFGIEIIIFFLLIEALS